MRLICDYTRHGICRSSNTVLRFATACSKAVSKPENKASLLKATYVGTHLLGHIAANLSTVRLYSMKFTNTYFEIHILPIYFNITSTKQSARYSSSTTETNRFLGFKHGVSADKSLIFTTSSWWFTHRSTVYTDDHRRLWHSVTEINLQRETH